MGCTTILDGRVRRGVGAGWRRRLACVATAGAVVVGVVAAQPSSVLAAAEAGSRAWTIDTIAGTGSPGYSGDGGPATAAQLQSPFGVVVDAAGNLYIADTFNHVVRKVSPLGVITTIAGTGEAGFNGDGVPATSAMLNGPIGVDVDGQGNVYIAENSGSRVRRVDPSGIITTVAGTGEPGYSGDGGPATAAQISYPTSVEVDDQGNVYVGSPSDQVVRKVDPSGIITTVAGTGQGGFSGDGGPATAAQFNGPFDLALDDAGNLFIADSGNGRVRKVAPSGIITTVAGTGEPGEGGDGGPATSAQLLPLGLEVQGSGILFISDNNSSAIRRVDASGTINTVAGMGSPGYSGDGGYGPFALLNQPAGLALDGAGNLFIADRANNVVRRLVTAFLWIDSTPEPTKVGETFAYDLSISGLPATAAGVVLEVRLPAAVAFGDVTSTQGSCARNGNTVACQLGTIEPGQTVRVHLTVTAQRAGVIPLTATATPLPGPDTVTAYTRVAAADCGRVLNRSTRLRADIGPCAGNGVIIGADNISLDLAGYRIFGFDGPGTGNDAGIRLPGRRGVRVVNGKVTGFDAGVVLNGGRNNIVSRLTVRDNVGPDRFDTAELGDGILLIDSAANSIIDNVITHNGIFDGIGVLGELADDNVIKRNTVVDTVGPFDGGAAGQGIIVNGAGLVFDFTAPPVFITGTVVQNNIVRGNGASGISNINNVDARIVGNEVRRNGFTNSPGNGIGVQVGFRALVPTRVLVQANQVHGNAADGIQVQNGATQNRIIANDAANNNAAPISARGFDLHDLNRADREAPLDCDSNVWDRNRWGSGYYNPACTAAGGSGPPIPPEPETLDEPSCFDEFDNDQDGLIDFDDPGCKPPPEGPPGDATCSDTLDNDRDSFTDSDDPDCAAPPALAAQATTTPKTGPKVTPGSMSKAKASQLPPTRRRPKEALT